MGETERVRERGGMKNCLGSEGARKAIKERKREGRGETEKGSARRGQRDRQLEDERET